MWNMKVTVIPIVIGALGTVTKVLEIRRQVKTIAEIGQNTEKSPRDLRRFVVTERISANANG